MLIFIITQMHGVPFKRWQKGVIAALMIGGGAWFYALQPEGLGELGRAVFFHYAAVAICAGLIWLIMRPFINRAKSV